jgi:hypothetical protein
MKIPRFRSDFQFRNVLYFTQGQLMEIVEQARKEALLSAEAAILSASYSLPRAQQGPMREAAEIVRRLHENKD